MWLCKLCIRHRTRLRCIVWYSLFSFLKLICRCTNGMYYIQLYVLLWFLNWLGTIIFLFISKQQMILLKFHVLTSYIHSIQHYVSSIHIHRAYCVWIIFRFYFSETDGKLFVFSIKILCLLGHAFTISVMELFNIVGDEKKLGNERGGKKIRKNFTS